MRVTAIEPESRSGGVRVQVDGRPFGTVAPGDVAALGLSVGAVLDERAAGALTERAEVFGARTVALSMLAARALPSAELVRRLVRKGHAKGAAEAAIEGLGETGLIDDAEFARHYVRTHARQRLGPRRLDADLRRLGVADSVAEAAVRETLAADGVDPHAVLQEAAAKKVRALAGLDAETARRRLRSYLLRRGFGGAEVSAVVKDAFPR